MKLTDEAARTFAAKLIMQTVLADDDRSDPMRFNLMRVGYFLTPSKNEKKLEALTALLAKVMPAEQFKDLREQFEQAKAPASLKDLEIGETFLRLKVHHLEYETELAKRALEILKTAARAAERISEPEKVK